MHTTLATVLRSERGTTLVELLVAIPLCLAVAGAIMGMTSAFSNNEKTIAARSSAVESAQVALDRITRDVRQASAISTTAGTASSTLALTTMLPTATGYAKSSGTVTWTCTTTSSPYTCSRASSVTYKKTDDTSATVTTASGTLLTVTGSSTGANSAIFKVIAATTTAGPYVEITAKVPTRSPALSTSPTIVLYDSAGPVNA